MAQLYDIVIFGASGFTGKYVLKEALKFLSPNSPLTSLALAGRSSSKLTETLKWASKTHPTIPILVADTSDPPSLRGMASQAKLVLNCVGPFRLHGEPVVDACVEAGCDYLDICGEPEFMERMEAVYYERAVEMGSLVVSACGFDSVPAELGLMFNLKQWVSPKVPNRVQAYVSLESGKGLVGNFATFESAVLGTSNADKLAKLRRSARRRARPSVIYKIPENF
ncbi:putative saccharopine dehydrogenase, NADP binding domain, NAD(P)-binding domain superfamily [Helianthus anomalus]